LAPYLAGSGPARQRFAREAKAAAAVVHEHVVPIHNVETDGQSPYLVMRYVAGESLQARIDRLGPLDVRELLRIAMQAASGLAAAHSHGLIHRDIKPSNILVESSVERSLITDFGLARAADDASLTNTGYHPGTPQFMSPEQARGDSLDARSDLFSLGSVMYTMAAGRAPFRSETSYGVLRRITDTHPRDIQEINPDIPSWLCSLIGKLMEKAPGDRYQSAEELSEVLALCLAHVQRPTSCRLPSDVLQLDARTQSKRRWHGSFRLGTWLLASVISMAAVLCLLFWLNTKPFASVQNLGAKESANTSTPSAGAKSSSQGNAESAAGQPESSPPKPLLRGPRKLGPPEPSEVLRSKLSALTTIQLEGADLRDGVTAILKDIDVSFRVNDASLKNENIDWQRTVEISGSGTAFVMLQRFLDRFQASFIVHETEVEIVAGQYAQSHPVTRYYELSLIQPGNEHLPAIVSAIEMCGKSEAWSSRGGSFTISRYDSMLIVKADEVTHHQIEQLLSQLNAWRVP
jgi:serine/threonine protein kinase